MTDEEQASRRFVLDQLRRGYRDEAEQRAQERRGKMCPIQLPMKGRWPR